MLSYVHNHDGCTKISKEVEFLDNRGKAMRNEKVSVKMPAIKVRSLYHRPTEQHRDETVYRRKGKKAQRVIREESDYLMYFGYRYIR